MLVGSFRRRRPAARTFIPEAPIPAAMQYEFECPHCGWTGTQPTLDAHLNPFCPVCGKPAEFAEVLRVRREKRR